MDGAEVLQRVRSWSDVPVIVLSGRANEDEKVRLLDLGADDYVIKPFGMPELVARGRAAIRRRQRTASGKSVMTVGRVTMDFMARSVAIKGPPRQPDAQGVPVARGPRTARRQRAHASTVAQGGVGREPSPAQAEIEQAHSRRCRHGGALITCEGPLLAGTALDPTRARRDLAFALPAACRALHDLFRSCTCTSARAAFALGCGFRFTLNSRHVLPSCVRVTQHTCHTVDSTDTDSGNWLSPTKDRRVGTGGSAWRRRGGRG